MNNTTCDTEKEKSQFVRLVDVFVLGPFMMWVSQQNRMSADNRRVLWLIGLATIIYNGKNFLANIAQKQKIDGICWFC